MEWLSNDQKGKMAFSVPAIWRASSELTGRTQRVLLPSASVAVNAIIEPSGDITAGPAVSPVGLKCVFSGGVMTVRMD